MTKSQLYGVLWEGERSVVAQRRQTPLTKFDLSSNSVITYNIIIVTWDRSSANHFCLLKMKKYDHYTIDYSYYLIIIDSNRFEPANIITF